MRWAAAVAVLGLVVAVLVLTAPPEPEPTPGPPAPEPPAPEPPTPELEDPTPDTPVTTLLPRVEVPDVSRVLGILPDGTRYSIRIDPGIRDKVSDVTLGIVIDMNGGARPVGEVDVRFSPSVAPGFRYGLHRMSAGDIAVTIRFGEDVLEHLGQRADQVITSSIRLDTTRGLPVLELDPPFRWPVGSEPSAPMEVRYESFVVRAGCEELAVACSQTGAVQVIPTDPASWPDSVVTITADAPRPTWHPSFVEPGPLTPRMSHDVIWTGAEMIVWGGIGEGSELIDGAAFDPGNNLWRVLAPAPLSVEQVTRAVWTGDVMVVVAEEATLTYDPRARDWSVLAEGRSVEQTAPPPVWDGEHVYLWSRGIERLEPVRGDWTSLPDPPIEANPNPLFRSLHAAGRLLFAVSAPDPCGGPRSLAAWDGSTWTPLPTPNLDGQFRDCSPPRHTGVLQDALMVWNASNGTALLYDVDGARWVEAHGFPFGMRDLTAGGLTAGDGILVAEAGRGALYDHRTGSWRNVVLPGWGTAAEMVWTGEEFLAWGLGDAWRWRPPES